MLVLMVIDFLIQTLNHLVKGLLVIPSKKLINKFH